LPEVGLQGYALYGRTSFLDNFPILDNDVTTAGVMAQIRVPLYQGGEVSARTRRAKAEAARLRMTLSSTRRSVREAAITAWQQYETAQSVVGAREAQIIAAERALAGVMAENEVGRRTSLDVLDAQQELVDARVQKMRAERDRIVARYAVLAAIGRLTAQDLGLAPRHTD